MLQTPRLRNGFLLWATVRSSEEYGFVMATGVPAGGFLHRDKWVPARAPIPQLRKRNAFPLASEISTFLMRRCRHQLSAKTPRLARCAGVLCYVLS